MEIGKGLVALLLPLFLMACGGPEESTTGTPAQAESHTAADVITFGGLSLGATMEEYKARFPVHQCTEDQCEYDMFTCSWIHREEGPLAWEPCQDNNVIVFGGVKMDAVTSTFREGKLADILFKFTPPLRINDKYEIFSEPFDDAVSAKIAKQFGPPTRVQDSVWKAPDGKSIERRRETWERATMVLIVIRGTPTKGGVRLMTREELARGRGEIEKKGTND